MPDRPMTPIPVAAGLVWSDLPNDAGKEARCECGSYTVGLVRGYMAAIWRGLNENDQIADEIIGRVASEKAAMLICQKHRSARIRAALSPETLARLALVERMAAFIGELRDYKPTMISGHDPRDHSGQSDVDDMMPLNEFEAFQADARAILAEREKANG